MFDPDGLLSAPPVVTAGVSLHRNSQMPLALFATALVSSAGNVPHAPMPTVMLPPMPSSLLLQALSYFRRVRFAHQTAAQLWLLLDFYGPSWSLYAPVTTRSGLGVTRSAVNPRELSELDFHQRLAGVITDVDDVDDLDHLLETGSHLPSFDGLFFTCQVTTGLHVLAHRRIGGVPGVMSIESALMLDDHQWVRRHALDRPDAPSAAM